MRRVLFCAVGALALIVATSAPSSAQDKKPKKRPNQVVDRGHDSSDATAPAEKNVNGIPVTFHANGAVSAVLDESFEEATVVTRNADGTFSYSCVHGLPVAARVVKTAKPAASAKRTLEVK